MYLRMYIGTFAPRTCTRIVHPSGPWGILFHGLVSPPFRPSHWQCGSDNEQAGETKPEVRAWSPEYCLPALGVQCPTPVLVLRYIHLKHASPLSERSLPPLPPYPPCAIKQVRGYLFCDFDADHLRIFCFSLYLFSPGELNNSFLFLANIILHQSVDELSITVDLDIL